jgi:hypothetical protein
VKTKIDICNSKKSRIMEDEPKLQMRTDSITPRYAYHKPFTVKFPDRCEWQNRCKTDAIQTPKKDWSCTQTGLRPIKALVLRCTDEAQESGTACVGLHTTIFQAEIYAKRAV